MNKERDKDTASVSEDARWTIQMRYGSLAICALAAVAVMITLARAFWYDQQTSGGWGCEMSWMTPSYVPVAWEASPRPKYRLYLYREQGWDLDARPSGQPVIFVPGNAGSYQQVRSIASSASRQYHDQPGAVAGDMRDATPRDFYTVDYNEDFSALHGPTLDDQARYLSESLKHILRQYDHLDSSKRPKQVSIIGHSMGGIVARLAVAHETRTLVDVILTMSTPHALPPLPFDWTMHLNYLSLQKDAGSGAGTQPLLISICGGVSDAQIVSDACALPSSGENGSESADHLSIYTTGMPGAWTGCDHQAIVWCHQIRWRVARFLLDMTKSQSPPSQLGMARSWFLGDRTRSSAAPLRPELAHRTEIQVDSPNAAIFLQSSTFTSAIANPLDVLGLEWCTEQEDCSAVQARATWLPMPRLEGQPFPMSGEGSSISDVAALIELDHLTLPGRLALYSEGAVRVEAGSPSTFDLSKGSWSGGTSSLLTSFEIRRYNSALRVWKLFYRTSPTCAGRLPIIRHRSGSDGINHEERWYPSRASPISLHSHLSSSPYVVTERPGITLDFLTTESCPVQEIRLQLDWKGCLAKLVLRYRVTFIAWTVGWIFVMLASQARTFRETGSWPQLSSSANRIIEDRLLVYTVSLSGLAMALGQITPHWSHNVLLGTDDPLAIGFAFLIGCSSCGVASVFAVFCDLISIAVRASVLRSQRSAKVKQLAAAQSAAPVVPARTMFDRKQILSALALIVLVWTVMPAQLASVIVLTIHAVFIGSQRNTNGRNLAQSALFLAICALPFHGAVLLVWSRNLWHNFRYPFSSDHNVIPMLPLLYIVEKSSEGIELKDRRWALKIFEMLGTLFAWSAFLFGGRYAFILPWQVSVLLANLCMLVQ